jgi:hypothetical protein
MQGTAVYILLGQLMLRHTPIPVKKYQDINVLDMIVLVMTYHH